MHYISINGIESGDLEKRKFVLIDLGKERVQLSELFTIEIPGSELQWEAENPFLQRFVFNMTSPS